MPKWKKWLLWLLVILGILAAGFWVVTTPDNAFMRLFRQKISTLNAKVVTGPYPSEEDLVLLKKDGVTTLIALLDPDLPYERVLLDREREMAGKYGMKMLNFPMISILGSNFGDQYDQNAAAAADAAMQEPGRVYMHCYLGRHRVKTVGDILRSRQASTDSYAVRESERASDIVLLDEAQAHYDAGRISSALASIAKMTEMDPPAKVLRAWATYRSGDIINARGMFQDVLMTTPARVNARTGLGYCGLRMDDLAAAEKNFTEAIAERPEDGMALTGLGMLYYRQNRLDDAAKYLESSLKQHPDDAEVKDLLAKIAARKNQPPAPGK